MLDTLVITELDAARIRQLGQRQAERGRGFTALDALLDVTDAAEVVPGERVPPDVVTVNSTLTFRDVAGGERYRVTVVYPADVSIGERRISILSPVGRSLLGRRVGESIALDMPDGGRREILLETLHYQPEASGDMTR